MTLIRPDAGWQRCSAGTAPCHPSFFAQSGQASTTIQSSHHAPSEASRIKTALTIPPEFDAAPNSERIAFVEALWDRIAQNPDAVAIPNSHQCVLDERLQAYRSNPQAGRLWGEVRDALLETLRRA